MSVIHLSIRHINELFEPLDPSPLRKRALGRNAESYILGSVRERSQHATLRLLVDLPESLRAQVTEVTEGIHEHFRLAHVQREWRFRRRLRAGGTTLGIGLAVLVISLLLRSLLGRFEGQLAQGLGEGLLILGWVAMWRPCEILLYEHWETHLGHATLERLSEAAVEYSFVPDAVLQP